MHIYGEEIAAYIIAGSKRPPGKSASNYIRCTLLSINVHQGSLLAIMYSALSSP